MTEKNKYKLHKKLEKVKQLIIIALMVISGLWYVTKGREKDNAAYAFTEQKSAMVTIEKDDSANSETEATEADDSANSETEATEADDSANSETGTSETDDSGNTGTSNAAAETGFSDSDNLINLNHATQKELETLPGVGPATAKNIIDYREKYGGFADIEEIKNVKRIGDKTYEKLKEYITV